MGPVVGLVEGPFAQGAKNRGVRAGQTVVGHVVLRNVSDRIGLVTSFLFRSVVAAFPGGESLMFM